MNIKRIGLIGGNYSPNSGNNTTGDNLWKVQNNLLIAQDSNRSITLGTSISIGTNAPTEISKNGMIVSYEGSNIIYIGSQVHICEETQYHLTIGSGGIKLYNDEENQEIITIPEKVNIGYFVTIGNHVTIQDNFNTNRYIDSHNDLKPECIPTDSSLKNSSKLAVNIEPQSNGNIKIGDTLFMPATPSGDPMHYAYEAAGAEYNATTDFIVKNAPWKDMVDTIEDKAKWGFDIVDASQVKQMTIGGTTYNYVQTTRTSPEGTTEPRYFLVGQASSGTWVEDETKVFHLPGHWYLNGLGDITGPEIALCYVQTMPWYATTTLTKAFRVQQNSDKITLQYRTTFRSNREFATIASNINCESMCYGNPYIEVFILTFMTQKVNVIVDGIDNAFTNANNMKYLIGQLYSSTSITLPNNIRSLSITISKIINFAKSSYISKPSILYIIQNAMPSVPITIILHADRYAQLAQDADIVAALEAKNAALEGTSGSISLVSA